MKYYIDTEQEQINLFDERWYRIKIDKDQSIEVPSVTTILEALPKGVAYLEWYKNTDAEYVKQETAEIGSAVHNLIQYYLTFKGVSYDQIDLINETKKVIIWERFNMWLDWYIHKNINPIETEYIVFNNNYAGTVDMICREDGKIVLYDWKTGNNIYDSAYLQVSAYKKAYEVMTGVEVDGVKILQINPKLNKKGWREYTVDNIDYYYDIFLSVLKIWNFQNKSAKPKYKTLPIIVNDDYINILKGL